MAYTRGIVTPDSRLVLASHARFRRFGEEGIIVDQQTAEVLVVNAVATRFVELSMRGESIRSSARLLSQEFEAAAETIETDLIEFAGDLLASGLGSASAS